MIELPYSESYPSISSLIEADDDSVGAAILQKRSVDIDLRAVVDGKHIALSPWPATDSCIVQVQGFPPHIQQSLVSLRL